MLEVKIDLLENENITGFDMGHMTFNGEINSATSSDKNHYMPIMVFIAICDLFYGLRLLIQQKKNSFEFVGADSSFIIWFEREKNNLLKARHKNTILSKTPIKIMVTGIYNSIMDFLKTNLNIINKDDPVYNDLQISIKEFEQFLDTLE